MQDETRIDLSIIIVSYNTCGLLAHCLQSVYAAQGNLKLEVFVVDNNSSDGSSNMVVTTFPQVTLICNSENLGFAAANNQAAKIARGRYVLLLNSDTAVKSTTLVRMVSFMDNTPDAGAAGVKLRYPDGTFQPSACFQFLSFWSVLIDGCGLKPVFPTLSLGLISQELSGQPTLPVSWVMGAFILIRRSVLEEVGLLDEQFFMYAEELDLCLRIRQSGYRVYYVTSSECIHYNGGSFGTSAESQWNSSKIRMLYTSNRKYMNKHFGKAGAIIYSLNTAIVLVPRIVYWWIAHKFAKGDHAVTKHMQYVAILRAMFTSLEREQ